VSRLLAVAAYLNAGARIPESAPADIDPIIGETTLGYGTIDGE
jgi:hypothetical protein